MVTQWGVDIKTAYEFVPTHIDVIALDNKTKKFGFGDQYKFLFCLGDPIILKKDLKGKDFVVPEAAMFMLKNFYENQFINFTKFAPIKNEAEYKLKSYCST